jgi:hypothetical protein
MVSTVFASSPKPTHGSDITYEKVNVNGIKTHAQESFHIRVPKSVGSSQETEADKTPLLFQPFTVKNLTLANRIVVAPMCMYSSKDGFMTDYHLAHLGSFAISGAGLVLAEATAVEPRGRISPADTGIWSDDHIPAIKRVVDFVHTQGSKMGIQLAHAGRKVNKIQIRGCAINN